VDAVHLLQVLRIVDEDDGAVGVALDGQPQVALEKLQLEVSHEVGGRHDLLVEGDEGHLVELAQRAAELGLGDLELLEEDRLHVRLLAARGGDGGVDFLLAHEPLREQVVELADAPLADLLLVVEGDAERLGQPRHAGLVVLGEARPALLVEELDDAERRPVLVQDGHGEDLRGAKAGALVPRAVEVQLWRYPPELGGVVRVGDVDRGLAHRHVAGHRLLADRNADLLHRVEGKEL
jgi:hypothetical protein